jgi:hypothetical protein
MSTGFMVFKSLARYRSLMMIWPYVTDAQRVRMDLMLALHGRMLCVRRRRGAYLRR